MSILLLPSCPSPSQAETVPENASSTLNVQFDTGKADIKATYHDDIKRLADFLQKHPSTLAVIEGHTDNVGSQLFNVNLSHRRAATVKAYLVGVLGIDRSRIRVLGYDYQRPIAENSTAQGRQANRRAVAGIDAYTRQNSVYSFFEDSDIPRGGFSIVNQETIDEKIESYKEKHGTAAYASRTVQTATLNLYEMWGGVFSHCAIRIETAPHSFYQLELQTLSDLKKAGMQGYHQIGAAITLLGVSVDQFDLVEFSDQNERQKLDGKEPLYATMPICISNNAVRRPPQWYQDCLGRYARSYNPDYALNGGQPAKVYDYNPPTHNCCNFAEEALQACGLEHCFDLGKSSGLDSKTGSLEK